MESSRIKWPLLNSRVYRPLPVPSSPSYLSSSRRLIRSFPVFVGRRQRLATFSCSQGLWHPETLPRCVRDGERSPLPRPGGRRDLFGRRLPQELTGEKARRQDEQLREQFRSHAMQLVEFAKARNRELRRSGVPPGENAPLRNIIVIIRSIIDFEIRSKIDFEIRSIIDFEIRSIIDFGETLRNRTIESGGMHRKHSVELY